MITKELVGMLNQKDLIEDFIQEFIDGYYEEYLANPIEEVFKDRESSCRGHWAEQRAVKELKLDTLRKLQILSDELDLRVDFGKVGL